MKGSDLFAKYQMFKWIFAIRFGTELKTSRQPEWNFRKKSMQMKNSAKFSRKSVEQQPG